MPTQSYKSSDYLKTPDDIAAYLNAAIEDSDDDPRALLLALRNVADALGGVSELARRTHLNREALSRALSGQRNPRLDTLLKILRETGVRIHFEAA